MTYLRPPGRVAEFEVPSFPTSSALRDRSEEARERSARLRDAGFQEGLQAGRAAGSAQVQEALDDARRAAARFDAAAEALRAAAVDFREREAVSVGELEQEAIALALGLARAVVGRELLSCDAPVLDAMRRASGLLPDRGTPVVRVHPDDEATVRDAVAADPGRWTGDVDVVADDGIEPGGCIVDVGSCRIDAQIASALDRMRSTLVPNA